MRNLFTIVLIFILGTLSVYAQPSIKQQENRKLIRQFEQERFKNQLQLLTKAPTPNQRNFDIIHYTLNLNLSPTTKILAGSVVVSGKSLINGLTNTEIDLASNLTIDSILQNGNPVTYSHLNDIIDIQLLSTLNIDESFSVEIFYYGNPVGSGLGGFGWDTHGTQPIIWTLSEPFGAPTWWPCKDDPNDKADSVFLNITVPNDLVVASNGLLKSTTPLNDSLHTYSWETRYPISTYLVSLAISNYEEFSDWYVYSPTDSMLLQYFVYPEDLVDAQEDFSITKDMVAFYSSVFGQYPFINEKYGMAEFPWGGGMEHQTMTSYGAPLIRGDHYYDHINAHELAHQWFGDYITMRRWSHIWLNEGFASYAEALWAENIGGEAGYHSYMASQDPGSFQGSLFVEDSTNDNALFSNTVYDKGSWALHMLRGVLGDETFFNCISNYTSSPLVSYGNAVTEDFQAICETTSGQDLNWFFSEWVYRAGRPNYVYNWFSSGTTPPYQTTLTINQSNTELYKMPIQIQLTGNGLDTTFTVWDSTAEQEFTFFTNAQPTDVQVDPQNWILKTIVEGSMALVSGSVIDANSNPVENAEVTWRGPIDPVTGQAANSGSELTYPNGSYQFQLAPGSYMINVTKSNYLMSKIAFIQVEGDTSNIQFVLSQPDVVLNVDSLSLTSTNGLIADTAFNATNIGSGEVLIQVVEGNHGATNRSVKKKNLTSAQIPIKQLQQASPAKVNSKAAIVDSLWQLLYEDPQEQVDNKYDIANVYSQSDATMFYVKTTTHTQPINFNNIRLNVFIDADNDAQTGVSLGNGIGADFLIVVGDFGGGVYGYLLSWNSQSQNFDFVGTVPYFAINAPSKVITFGLNKSSILNPNVIKIYMESYDQTNLFNTYDFIPSENLGYLATTLNETNLLNINPDKSIMLTDSANNFNLKVNTNGLSSGLYSSGVTVFTSHANGMKKTFLPISFEFASDISDDLPNVITKFEVTQNFPNPFNPTTTIKILMPHSGKVTAEIFNILGQNIYSTSKILSSGTNTFVWDGKNSDGNQVPSGIYFYRISNEATSYMKKMVLIR